MRFIALLPAARVAAARLTTCGSPAFGGFGVRYDNDDMATSLSGKKT
jgi:hypothetical protein